MKILFQGDSITDGNRFKDKELEWDKNHQIGHSYAYITTGILSFKYYDKGFQFINRGISGNKTDDLLTRWKEDCIDINPDVLVLLIGINDVFFHTEEDGFKRNKYENNLRNLLLQVREKNHDVKIVLLEPFCYMDTPLAKMYNVKKGDMKFVQKTVKSLANEFDAEFIPLQKDFSAREKTPFYEYWIWDGIHPTEAGHALIARKLIKKLEKTLQG